MVADSANDVIGWVALEDSRRVFELPLISQTKLVFDILSFQPFYFWGWYIFPWG